MKLTDLERYDIKAECFRQMTGLMAPGKSIPREAYGSDECDPDYRHREWQKWMDQYLPCVNAMMAAVESVMDSGE